MREALLLRVLLIGDLLEINHEGSLDSKDGIPGDHNIDQ